MPTKRDSPAHRDDLIFDVLTGVRVGRRRSCATGPYATFETRDAGARGRSQKAAASAWQDVFPVARRRAARWSGWSLSDVLRTMAANPDLGEFAIAHDLMVPPVSVRDTDDLQRALEVILEHGLREIIVVDENGKIVGFLDEAEITRVVPRGHGEPEAEVTARAAARRIRVPRATPAAAPASGASSRARRAPR